MPSQLAEAHIEAERRLQAAVTAALARIWEDLPGYDEGDDVDAWLAVVVPLILASQRQSAILTNAYLARALERQPLAIDVEQLIGEAVRGVTLEEVYRRPFVTLWSELGEGTRFEVASQKAVERAQSMASFDLQATMRDTADLIDRTDPNIYGYRRVANPDACAFCKAVDGAYVKGSDGFVMALHNHCNCGLEPNRKPHRGAVFLPDGTQIRAYQYGPLNEFVAVHEHGEMGPVLADPKHDFTTEGDLALV